jgi:hypothetical protein
MLSIYDLWTAKQVRSRVSSDNVIIRNANHSCLLEPIWCIVCEYTCEDPGIVDVLTKAQWEWDYAKSASLCVLLGYQDHELLFALELRVSETNNTRYFKGHVLYEVLLMLPVMQDDESEVACESPNLAIVELRDKLYSVLCA